MAEEITLGIWAYTMVLLISLLIFWAYLRNLNRIALYFSLFLLFFSLNGMFRAVSLLTGDLFLFFLHRLSLMLGPVVVLRALEQSGIAWLRKYKAPSAAGVLALAIAYYDAFVLKGFAGEQANIINFIPSIVVGGLGLFIAGFYIFKAGGKIGGAGKILLVAGVGLHGVLYFLNIYLVREGFASMSFYLGIAFSVMIAAGWWLTSEEGSDQLVLQS